MKLHQFPQVLHGPWANGQQRNQNRLRDTGPQKVGAIASFHNSLSFKPELNHLWSLPSLLFAVRYVLLIVSLSFCLNVGHTQTIHAHNYSLHNGLPSREAYDVFQDSKKFIWMATDNGVVRFDGTTMEVFNTDQGLTDPVVFGEFEDTRGRIWFRTYSGRLSYYWEGQIYDYKYNDVIDSLAVGILQTFDIDENDQLSFFSRDRLITIDSTAHLQIEKLPLYSLNVKTMASSVLVSMSGNSNDLTQIYINGRTIKSPHRASSLQNAVSRAIKIKSTIYMSYGNLVYKYENDSLSLFRESSKLVTSLTSDANGCLWIGYRIGGAEQFCDDQLVPNQHLEFLENNSISCVMEDHEGGFWFSTLEDGVLYISKSGIKNLPVDNPEKITTVSSNSQYVLVGARDGSVRFLDTKGKVVHRFQFKGAIHAIFSDSQDQVWVSSRNGGLYKITKDFERSSVAGTESIVSFSEDDHNRLWASGGVNVKVIDSLDRMRVLDSNYEIMRSICVQDTSVFLAGRLGLQVWSTKSENLRTRLTAFSKVKISNLVPLNDSLILVTSLGNEMSILNTKSLETFSPALGLGFKNIYAVKRTDSLLWLGTAKGLIITTVQNLISSSPFVVKLTTRQGLNNNKVSYLAYIEGNILAFTDDGVSAIPVSIYSSTRPIPIFYEKEILVNNQTSRITGTSATPIRLQHDQNNIEIRFGFISYYGEPIVSQYRLEPDSTWRTASGTSITFNSLSAGSYTTQIRYSTNNLDWTYATPIRFEIEEVWWKRGYTLLAFFLVLSCLIYLVFIYQIRRNKNRQASLLHAEVTASERERNRISKDLHDKVGTDLSALKMHVRRVLTNDNNDQADHVEERFQDIMKGIKEIIYEIAPPEIKRYGLFTSVQNHIEKLRPMGVDIEFNHFGKDITEVELSIHIFRIIQELISNSLKYSGATSISVHINTFKDFVNVIYEDNGGGFDYNSVKHGLGLRNIEARVQSIKGKTKFESGKFGVSYSFEIPNA